MALVIASGSLPSISGHFSLTCPPHFIYHLPILRIFTDVHTAATLISSFSVLSCFSDMLYADHMEVMMNVDIRRYSIRSGLPQTPVIPLDLVFRKIKLFQKIAVFR